MKLLIKVLFITCCFFSSLNAQELKSKNIKSKEFIVTTPNWKPLDFSAFTYDIPDTLKPEGHKNFGIYKSSKDTFKFFTSVPQILKIGNLTLRFDSLAQDEVGKLTITNSQDSLILTEKVSEQWYGESGTYSLNTLVKVNKHNKTIEIIILSQEWHLTPNEDERFTETIDRNITVYKINTSTGKFIKYDSVHTQNTF